MKVKKHQKGLKNQKHTEEKEVVPVAKQNTTKIATSRPNVQQPCMEQRSKQRLREGILWMEILGEPVSKKRRRRVGR